MDGDALADLIAVADHEARVLSAERHVLRLAAQHRALVDAVVLSEDGEALDHHVGADLAAVADRHAVLDDGVGADHDVRPSRAPGETTAVEWMLTRVILSRLTVASAAP